jgi:DNA-binding MarR family transcriptional regulator
VWNLDHGSRSIRAGIRLLMAGVLLVVSGVAVIAPSLYAAVWGGFARHRLPEDGTNIPDRTNRTDMFSSVNDIVDHPARPAEGTLALATELLGTISAIRRIARRAARLVWQDEPLPPAQSELLRLAAARPGLSVADAAHELRLAPNTVSTLVGRLTAGGLLDRSRAVSDGRSVRLSVTEAARRRIAGWRDLRAELGARALDQLSAADRDTLAAALPALQRFAAQLEENQ